MYPQIVDGYYLLDIGSESIIKSITISDFATINYYISYSIDDSDYKLIYRKTDNNSDGSHLLVFVKMNIRQNVLIQM